MTPNKTICAVMAALVETDAAGWMPMTENPREDGNYLLALPGQPSQGIVPYVEIGSYWPDGEWSYPTGDGARYWRPLPELPASVCHMWHK
jgi:hypothetical protein